VFGFANVALNRYTSERIRYFIDHENRSTVAEALSDIAYRHITKKLVGGELAAGQKLSEQTIAAECGISRTPVREAVRRLTEEGVLYQIPSSGTYVARPDRRQVIDAFEVRMALESFAMERAVRTLTKENRAELRKACETMHATAVGLRERRRPLLDGRPLVAFLTADLSFHLLLLKAAGNHLAIKIVTNAYQRNHFFGHYSHKRDLHHVAWAWRQHAEIERAVRRGDPRAAARWMHAHIAWSLADALAAFDAASAAAARSGRAPSDPVHDALSQLTARFA
jgi:DNA-binding GntR family transcriptional regulator